MLSYLVPSCRRRIDGLFFFPVGANQQYLTTADAIRAGAASWVAIAHAWYFTFPVFKATQEEALVFLKYGSKAVAIFCVLSGYLIYRSVKRCSTVGDLRAYALRRVLRIVPVYLIAAILCIVVGQASLSPAGLISEVFMLRILDFPVFANPPAWSVYVEFLFYMILPFFVILFTPKRMIVVSIVAIILLTLSDGAGPREMWLWKYFFFGILVAELTERLGKLRPTVAVGLFVAGLALLAVDALGPSTDWLHRLGVIQKNLSEYTFSIGVGVALILLAMPFTDWINKVLAFYPIRIIGVSSYSLFLLHPFVILACFPTLQFSKVGNPPQPGFADMPLAPWWYLPFVFAPAMYAWAAISFVVVERPFLVRRNRGRAAARSVVGPAPAT